MASFVDAGIDRREVAEPLYGIGDVVRGAGSMKPGHTIPSVRANERARDFSYVGTRPPFSTPVLKARSLSLALPFSRTRGEDVATRFRCDAKRRCGTTDVALCPRGSDI